MSPGCAAIMQLGRAMKQQRRGILERLRQEEARREYIKWELRVANGKMQKRARRIEATNTMWNTWCTAKNSKSRQLDMVLGSPSGRRLWDEYMQNELTRAASSLPLSPGQHRGEPRNRPSLDTTEPRSAEDRLAEATDVRPSVSNLSKGTKGSTTVTRGQGDVATVVDSRIIVAELHLALESLFRQGEGGNIGDQACAQFCTEWPRGCALPPSFDRALLRPAWSKAAEDLSDQCVSAESLQPAREAARLEAQRILFAEFLGSGEGQAFVIHTVQDGTLEPTEVEGFMRDLTEGAHFDEDAQGFRRVVAHGDEWMHSRLVHDGVEQRVRVEAAEPLLRAVQEENDRHISAHRGELAAIVQHVYSLAASRLQPFIRGALTRQRLPDAFREMFSYATLCAAVEIQRTVRGCIARRRCRQVLVSSASDSLVRLQARIRGVLLRQRVAKKWTVLLDRQALEIQRVFRGHRCREALNAVLNGNTWARSADLHGWASLVLQTQARVWLARRVAHLKRVEVGLSSRVSEIADKLASSDDSRSVSAVLGQIDRDYRKYDRVISELKAREEEMATTFVEKVLERRDADIAGAWTRFVGEVTEFGANRKKRSEARRAHPHPVTRGERARASKIHDDRLLVLMERYGIPAHAKALPSAYLRAALPMHLKLRGCEIATGFDSHAQPRGRASKTPTEGRQQRRTENINQSSGGRALFPLKDRGPCLSQTQRSARSRIAGGSVESSITSVGGGPSANFAGRTTPVGAQNPNSKLFDSDLDHDSVEDHSYPCPGSGAGGAERRVANSTGESNDCTFSPRWESEWDAERTSRGLDGDAGSRFPGSSVRQDMPSGMKEVVERLCAAAFLRGHVPHGMMPKGTTPEDSYQRYLNLPPSLAKIRHEQLCTEASRPVASALRSRGYTTLEQLLPLSKLEHLLRHAGAGADESAAASSLAREIKQRHDISGGNDGNDRELFSPLSPFSRWGLAGSRRTPDIQEAFPSSGRCGSGGITSTGTSRGSARPGTTEGKEFSELKKKKAPLRISLEGLGSGGGTPGAVHVGENWDPSRYTTRPEEWRRPPPSVIKRQWDQSTKTFVPVNNYSFDALVSAWRFGDNRAGDMEQGKGTSGAYGSFPSDPVADSLSGPLSTSNVYAKRMADIMREEYGTFFDGMTQSARELYQYIINDSASWGSVEDPIGTLLCRAAFHVVEHPSPATKAELAEATEKNLASKGVGGRRNNLARPIALAGKFNGSRRGKELAQVALAQEHVPMGPEAFRAFVGQLDSTRASRPLSSSPLTHNTARTGRSYGAAVVDPCRSLLERRMEAAVTLANPFKVRLEADGISNVRELARVPARAWGLSPYLVDEIERMLGLLVARTCALEHYSAHRGHKRNRVTEGAAKPKKICFSSESGPMNDVPRRREKNPREARKRGQQQQQQQSFGFDPRFQRSPLDPFGRPPRLERIHPCPSRRQETDDNHRAPSTDEDDLPPGVWDAAPSSKDPPRSDVVGNIRTETETNGATDVSFPSAPIESLEVDTHIELHAEDMAVDPRGQEPVTHRKLQSPPRRDSQPSHQTAKRTFVRGRNTNNPTAAETNPSTTRFTCRVRPHCRAVFAGASALRTHERSHSSAPEYHRLRRAPQLFRDRPPASSEGAGAAAEKFRLRTTLPRSIRQQLKKLEAERKSPGGRRSIPAGPDLPGAVCS
ncbi:unnamed protein product [Scytosiphon promiscuus]